MLWNVRAVLPDCTASHPEDRKHFYRPEKLDLAQPLNSASRNVEFHVYLLSDIMASSVCATKFQCLCNEIPVFVQRNSSVCATKFQCFCNKIPVYVQRNSSVYATKFQCFCNKIPVYVQRNSSVCATKFQCLCNEIPVFVLRNSSVCATKLRRWMFGRIKV